MDRQAALLSAADVLLTCAIAGGNMAADGSDASSAAAHSAIITACERCSLAVPCDPVAGAIAPPIKPDEARRWLQLSANAFKAAGWTLEAGRLLLSMGPDLDAGRYWALARRLLHSVQDKASVALVYEHAARQELGLQARISSSGEAAGADAGDQGDADDGAGAKAVVPKGLGGSFMTTSKLLLEALRLYLRSGWYGDCTRMLEAYEGLKPLLKRKEVDEITLVRGWARVQGDFAGGRLVAMDCMK